MTVTLVDYATGNIQSVVRALAECGAEARCTADPAAIAASDRLILPGVGHAGRALARLREEGLVDALEAAVFDRGVPVLGICLGMQIMAEHVEEGDSAGLGWVRGRAVRLNVSDTTRYKVPHIGWNSVLPVGGSRLQPNEPDDPFYYFCHEYSVEGVTDADRIAEFHYERNHLAMFEKRNIFGVQFHPEKSQAAGRALLRQFLALG